jgi:hypothetical protein
MTFDPKKTRRQLKSFAIDFYRRESLAECKAAGSLNGTGWLMTSCGIECLLVGFFDVGQELLLKARAFVRASIEYKEKPYFTKHHRLRDFALLNWLVARSHDLKSLKESVRLKERWFSERRTISKSEVQAALPYYLDAEEYETLMRRYESAGLTRPATLRRIQGEGTMCYVIARHRLGLDYTPEEIEAAVDTFLKRRVLQWLGYDGAYRDAAHWMKLAFWKKGDDPIATVLRCYDYLPGLKPPKYP